MHEVTLPGEALVVGVTGIILTVALNVIFVAIQWGRTQQIIHDMKEIMEELKGALEGITGKLNKHGERIVRLETKIGVKTYREETV